MAKTLNPVDETKVVDVNVPAPDGMDSMDPDLLAVQQALAEEDSQLYGDPLGAEPRQVSVAEQMAKEGKSTAEVDGETMQMSQGAARRFALFDKDGNGFFSKEEVAAIEAQIKENNMTVGLKDDSDGPFRDTNEDGVRLDNLDSKIREKAKNGQDYDPVLLGENGEDGKISVSTEKNGYNHYEGVLGSFDYDPKVWSIGYKTVYDSIGGETVDAEIPVLRYNGDKKNGNDIKIPEGVKSLDYTFEGNQKLESFPVIPDGVESLHSTFKQCGALDHPCSDFAKDERGAGFLWGNHWFNAFGWNEKNYKRVGLDGITVLPDSVKDVSYCFEDCSKLRNGFTNTNSATHLQNMDGYARNCKKLETILDVSEARLLPVSAQTDAYDGINTKMITSIGGVAMPEKDGDGVVQENGVLKFGESYCGISMYANEDSIYATGKTETKPYTVDERDELNYVKALQDYRANDRMYLADPSAVANATSGMATTATYKDENGQTVHTSDPTKVDEAQGTGTSGGLGGIFGGSGGTGEIIQRLGFGFLEYKVLNSFIKNPLVSLGITAGGQAMGILPGTLGGVGKTLSAVGSMFGKDSAIGGMISKLGDSLSGLGGEAENGKGSMTKEEASNMNVIKDASQAAEAQNSTMSAQSLAKLNDNMANRGAYSGEYGTFQELATVQEGYGVFNNVRMASEDSMAAFSVALMKKQQQDGGELSEASKQELALASKQILQSWSTYGENASDSIRTNYGGNPEEQAKGEAGLGKMMRAAVVPDLELIRGLNDRYQFLSEQDVAELDTLQFKGLDGVTFSTYQPGANYAPADDPYVKKVDSKGKPVEGVFEDYMPETYDVDLFMDKAIQKHDRDYRTESYVSTFNDGAAYASSVSVGGSELGTKDITRPQPVQKNRTSRADRVAQAEGLLPSGMDSESLTVDYES